MKHSCFATILASLYLSGCAHDITLMARDSGQMGAGSAGATMGNSGKLSITIEDDTYEGKWVYTSGGSVGLLSTYGANSTTGTAVGLSGSGVGNAMLRSVDGKSMRCEFQYSEWTSTGIGVCLTGDGKLYDMQIH
jgi:hypothetical protein